MKKLFLVGDYNDEVQRTELIREQRALESAGYKVVNICDITCDPETGQTLNEERWMAEEIFMNINHKCDAVANYFTSESPLSLNAIRLAQNLGKTVHCSSRLWWVKQEQPTHFGMFDRMMKYLQNVSGKMLHYKHQ